MKVKICKECRFPIQQCQCSEKRKEEWRREQANHLSREIDYLDSEIANKRGLISHQEEIQRKMKQKWKNLRYQANSFEIDDAIADTLFILWEKGYETKFCCSGHPEKQNYGLYISFAQDYYFDFSDTAFEEGWVYTRYSGHCLRLNLTVKFRQKLQRDGTDITEYFLRQRELLNQWAQNLPPARLALREESLPGLKISSSKIPVRKSAVKRK